jgi:Ca2+-binding EF-hand superfamily protein
MNVELMPFSLETGQQCTGGWFVMTTYQVQDREFTTRRMQMQNENVKELLLMLDTNKNGRISKQEWMNFMEAEFNKLDKDGDGELDPKELLQSKVSVRSASS